MSELRRDPIIGRWVIISTERGKRPSDYKPETEESSNRPCPFCAGNEKMTPKEISQYYSSDKTTNPGWQVRIIPNKYPALAIEGSLNRKGEGMYDLMSGIGAHEVIIETPEHKKDVQQYTDENTENIICAYRDRLNDLKRDMRFKYILIFKNHGAVAGASLEHPHSQLIAMPIVPKRVIEEIKGGQNYFESKERCVFCDIMSHEMSTAKRIVAENDHFVALCPFASRFPFEIWVLPKEHSSDFEFISRELSTSLAFMLKNVLNKLKQVLGDPPYNYIIHNSPLRESNLAHYHWHLEIIPKLTKVAGFEWGTGFYINPTPPEEAAKFLREAE